MIEILGDQVAIALYALVFLLSPCAYSLVILLLLQVAGIVLRFPMVENHYFVVLLVDIFILTYMLPWYFLGKNLNVERMWERIAPVIRWLTILLYLCAFFHKLNTGFLDFETSCVVFFYDRMRIAPYFFAMPELNEMMKMVLIALTLLVEATIPLLLLRRKSWFLGIVLGSLFHIVISQTMRDFPLFAFALYIAFIPSGVMKQFLDTIKTRACSISRSCTPVGVYVTLLLVCIVLSIVGTYSPDQRWLFLRFVSFRIWSLAAIFMLGWFSWYVYHNRLYRITRDGIALASRWHVIAPVLLVVNCFLPYLGLRTLSTLSMFSNLRTDGGVQNHILLRTRLLPFSYQDDLVEVIRTNDPNLQDFVESGDRIVWHAFSNYVHQRIESGEKEVQLTYRRNGILYGLSDAATDPILLARERWWERIYLGFRSVPPGSSAPCKW